MWGKKKKMFFKVTPFQLCPVLSKCHLVIKDMLRYVPEFVYTEFLFRKENK